MLLLYALTASLTINDLHEHYNEIFPSNNRNAASHLWSSWIMNKAPQLGSAEFNTLFSGFCPVSGSPVSPTDYNTYAYRLSSLASNSHAEGLMHHCCAPCVCDTMDMIKADTLTVSLAGGAKEFTFAVIGDPCRNAALLQQPFVDPFSGQSSTLADAAPEVHCDANGKLRGATYSDHGGVIIGLLREAPTLAVAVPSLPTPGRITNGVLAGKEDANYQDEREFSDFCAERAKQGYNSGMGVIFRKVARITPLATSALPDPLALPPPPKSSRIDVSGACGAILPSSRMEEVHRLIQSEPVMVFGMLHSRCLSAASDRLQSVGACFRLESWEDPKDDLWKYMQCLHPNEIVNGMMMHSYVYIKGEYLGNGFVLLEETTSAAKLLTKLTAASASLTCKQNCDSLASPKQLAELATMKAQPLVLIGWAGCPCTSIARKRFESVGACFVERVWAGDTDPMYKHLQCVHGAHHHSFVFINGKFIEDGFYFEEKRLDGPRFEKLIEGSGTSRHCQRKGDENLFGSPLKSCTQSNDGSTTGWTRTGSCNWDPSDSGYHEVCVTMSDEFLKQSAKHDANDLSSVVQSGGHWCICAWAWAAAVKRDPSSFEGITLECDRTNNKLREVYNSHITEGSDLVSPSGAAYKAKAALDAVDKICPAVHGDTATQMAAREKSVRHKTAAKAVEKDHVTSAHPGTSATKSIQTHVSLTGSNGNRKQGGDASLGHVTSDHVGAAGDAPCDSDKPWRLVTSYMLAFGFGVTSLLALACAARRRAASRADRLGAKRPLRLEEDDDKFGCYDSCEEGEGRKARREGARPVRC